MHPTISDEEKRYIEKSFDQGNVRIPGVLSVAFMLSFEEEQLSIGAGLKALAVPHDCPGARFSKVPKLFRRISGDMILFVSSKRRRLEERNFAVILIFIPFTTYEKTSFTE